MTKVAVVTGAAQGIGKGIAEVLAENGLTVALVDSQRKKLSSTDYQCILSKICIFLVIVLS